ncbi:MAG: hypothetical protein MUE73_15855 [Planctomycetes bacterium]|jgi:hypothetical protein|nr:hypothetical protein [Planctomycetota bacterium]
MPEATLSRIMVVGAGPGILARILRPPRAPVEVRLLGHGDRFHGNRPVRVAGRAREDDA